MTAPPPSTAALAPSAAFSTTGELELVAALVDDRALLASCGLCPDDFLDDQARQAFTELLAAPPGPCRPSWALPPSPPAPERVVRVVLWRAVSRALISINTEELRGLRGAPAFGLPGRAGLRAVVAAAAEARAAVLERVP